MTIDEAEQYIKEQLEVFGGAHKEFLKQIAEWLEELRLRRVLNLQCAKEYSSGYRRGKAEGYNKAIDEFAEALNKKISEFVLEHKDNLDFASGVSVVWNMVDEIAEQMKAGENDERTHN